MGKQKIRIKVNGADMEADVEPRLLLVHCVRDVFGLTGTHIGCDTTHCGACTVHLDGKPIKSCTLFAVVRLLHAGHDDDQRGAFKREAES